MIMTNESVLFETWHQELETVADEDLELFGDEEHWSNKFSEGKTPEQAWKESY